MEFPIQGGKAVVTMGLTALVGASAIAQTAATEPQFEVASIKPAAPDARGIFIQRAPGGRFNATNVPVRFLIIFDHDLRRHQLTGGPDSLDSERFLHRRQTGSASTGWPRRKRPAAEDDAGVTRREVCGPIVAALCLLVSVPLRATEYHGTVKFGGLPLPGATLTATQGGKKYIATTGLNGSYSFPDLPDGDWSGRVEMLCFASVMKEITIRTGVPIAEWELKMLPMEEIRAGPL